FVPLRGLVTPRQTFARRGHRAPFVRAARAAEASRALRAVSDGPSGDLPIGDYRPVRLSACRTRTPSAFDLIFCFGVFYRLPLHIAFIIGTAELERDYVINHVTGARSSRLTRRRTRLIALKSVLSSR